MENKLQNFNIYETIKMQENMKLFQIKVKFSFLENYTTLGLKKS